ncbi:SemiSWEET transporter [Mucilaginibacter panaciglaebae]|uniref:SemiSWEET transporter n=1 Tax=Mucilaginibacter panaciglaebae TaxID=502331 RepID=A0ABP7X4Q5_9SPHI
MNYIEIIGLAAAFCTTISFLPQAVKTIRSKNTEGISLSMYVVFTVGTFLWLLYGVMAHSLPVTAANAVTFLFAGIILGYKLRYR